MLNKQHLLGATAGAVAVATLGAAALTFAQTNTGATSTSANSNPAAHGVAGTVASISGNTITLTGKNGQTYTVNADGANITKDETVSVGDIKVGDTLMAQGTINGNTVTATNIHDGLFGHGFHRGPGMIWRRLGIRGTVTAINGNTLTVTATNPQTSVAQTYTVDAGSARVMLSSANSRPTQGALSDVHQGDTVLVAGPINGTTVTAKFIVDGQLPTPHGWGAQSSTTNSGSTSSTTNS